jgi:hypothetical protein
MQGTLLNGLVNVLRTSILSGGREEAVVKLYARKALLPWPPDLDR